MVNQVQLLSGMSRSGRFQFCNSIRSCGISSEFEIGAAKLTDFYIRIC